MSCKRLRPKARREQDFYLQWAAHQPTEEERLEFLRYDSHGSTIPPHGNPVFDGKSDYGLLVAEWKNAYQVAPGYEGVWPGGMYLVKEEYSNRRFMLMLIREFGQSTVKRWLRALRMQPLIGMRGDG